MKFLKTKLLKIRDLFFQKKAVMAEIKRKYLMKKDEKSFQAEFYNEAVLSYPPRSVTVAISSFCDNKCVFCGYHSIDAEGASNVYNLKYKLSLQDFKKIVDLCYKGRVPHLHICATGEPFFHSDILEMIDYSIKVYGKASVQTNFSRSIFEKKDYYNELIKRGDDIKYITTDILSGDPEEHNKLKKGSSYSDVLYAMSYINKHKRIRFHIHLILTKINYMHIEDLIDDLHKNNINAQLDIVNLHPHDFNEFTTKDKAYFSSDIEITKALEAAKEKGEKVGITVSIPKPFDKAPSICGSFWTRFQIWPVKGNDPKRYHENVIVGGCNAVVKGKLSTLGYIFDYNDILDLWNNEHFVKNRKILLSGEYPDSECENCQSYRK